MAGPLIGTSVQRVEDPHLLRGDTTYVANLDLPGALVAHYLTSIHAHARIVGVDIGEAREMPGVVDVVTAADLQSNQMLGTPKDYAAGAERPILADDVVRFVGEAIAVVVAETEAQAIDALEAIVVEYDPLPPVIGLRDAAADHTLLFPEIGTNIVIAEEGGSPGEADFSQCEVVVEAEFVNQRLAPCPLETRTAASLWTEDGRLVHYASCQGVHPLQQGLAIYYGLDLTDVQVITADVGGSFGAKARFYPEDFLLPFLAKRAGRPVRWTPFRSADMVGLGHSRAQLQTVKIGGDRDGTLKVLDVEILNDCGAYPAAASALARNAARIQPGPFRMANAHTHFRSVVTNTTPIVAYRGAGRPEGGALIDRAVDCFAAEIGMDPLEIRRMNLLRAEELPYTNPSDLYHDSGDYHEALELLVDELGFEGLRADQAARRRAGSTKVLGIGLSTFIDRTAGVLGTEFGAVELRVDGGFRVLTGSSPYGQGHYTTWAMLVADRTGVPLEQIEVFHGDTDVVPRGGITGGSRSAQKAGSAIAEAAESMVLAAKAQAAQLLEASPGDIVLDVASGRFHVTGAPGAADVGWHDVAQGLARMRQFDGADDAASADFAFSCESDFEPVGPTAPYGAYGAVVEVDTETGQVELLRMVTVDDAGTILNPMIALGQVHGGLGQAIGQALFEEFTYDDQGNPLTSNFLDYVFPSAADMPSFECHLTQNASPQNPLGAKGIGESGTIGGVPAVQNAVVDAVSHLGVRHIDLPLTPERVWSALKTSKPVVR